MQRTEEVLPLRGSRSSGKKMGPHVEHTVVPLLPGGGKKLATTFSELKILQLNVNHCYIAQQLLAKTAKDMKVDVVVVAEPLFDPGSWIFAEANHAAIWVTGINCIRALDDTVVRGNGFVRVAVGDTLIISCYLPLNTTIGGFRSQLDELANIHARWTGKNQLIGDFNVHSTAWG